jgi:4-amino-4-deoxy-L-arabinose transferase-like glycosyltransferase
MQSLRKSLPLRTLFAAAVLLRVLIFAVLGPTGSDHHYEVIEAILRDGRLPLAQQYAQAFHPPAYYLLSLPWAVLGGARFVEVFSLLLTILNTWLLFKLLEQFIANDRARAHAMALTAFLPHLVIYSILVSNDSLAFLCGTLALLAALRFESDPKPSNAALCGLVAALGLLTKGTLIAHAGVLLFVVALASWRRSARMAATCITVFVALALALGSYKYVENEVRYGRAFVHGMDFGQPWVAAQRPTIIGVKSWVDMNIATLMREPYAERREGGWTNPQSVPLLLYATFWHPYIPVSNFRGSWQWTPWIAQATYLLAIPATLLMFAGFIVAARRPRVWIPLAFLAGNLAIVLAAGVKYDAWSCFQSRLLFPSFAAIAFAFAWGLEWSERFGTVVARVIDATSIALYAAFLVYFGIEITFVIVKTLGA